MIRQESSKHVRKTLAHLLAWIGEHVRGFYTAVGAFLILGLLVAIATVGLFAGMAEMVEEGGHGTGR